jgi:hypothetical protein
MARSWDTVTDQLIGEYNRIGRMPHARVRRLA